MAERLHMTSCEFAACKQADALQDGWGWRRLEFAIMPAPSQNTIHRRLLSVRALILSSQGKRKEQVGKFSNSLR